MLAPPVCDQEFFGPLGEHRADLSVLTLHAGDLHRVVARRQMPHPGNDSSLSPALDRNALSPGHSAVADRRGAACDGVGEFQGQRCVPLMERQDCRQEVLGLFPKTSRASSRTRNVQHHPLAQEAPKGPAWQQFSVDRGPDTVAPSPITPRPMRGRHRAASQRNSSARRGLLPGNAACPR